MVIYAPTSASLNQEKRTPRARSARTPPGGIWHADPEVNSSIDVGFLVSNKNGLSDTYRGKDRFDGYFEPTTVDSYPGVLSG